LQVLLDNLLDFRIKLQPTIDLANRLPQGDMLQAFVQHNANPEDAEAKLESVKAEIRQLLNESLLLQDVRQAY